MYKGRERQDRELRKKAENVKYRIMSKGQERQDIELSQNGRQLQDLELRHLSCSMYSSLTFTSVVGRDVLFYTL